MCAINSNQLEKLSEPFFSVTSQILKISLYYVLLVLLHEHTFLGQLQLVGLGTLTPLRLLLF